MPYETTKPVADPREGTPDIIEDVLRQIGSIALMGLPNNIGYIFYADQVRAELQRLAAAVSKASREEAWKVAADNAIKASELERELAELKRDCFSEKDEAEIRSKP